MKTYMSLHNDDLRFSYQMLHLSSKGYTLFKIIYMVDISEGGGGGFQKNSKHLVAPPLKSKVTGKAVALVHKSIRLKRLFQVPHRSSGQVIILKI